MKKQGAAMVEGAGESGRLCRVPVVGIVGGVGSGKSAVARWVSEQHPVLVVEADRLGHAALETPSVRDQLVERFGATVLDAAGKIDRAMLAREVFGEGESQRTARRDLDGIMHPVIRAEMERQLRAVDPAQVSGVLLDAALLFEAGWEAVCDAVVFIEVNPQIRAERVARTRGWTVEQWRAREASQWPVEKKRSASTFVVLNEGDVSDAGRRVWEILRETRSRVS